MSPIKLNKKDCERLAANEKVVKVTTINDELMALAVGENFEAKGCTFKVQLLALRTYETHRQLVLNEGLRTVMPEAKTIAEAIKKFKGRGEEKKPGDVGVAALILQRAR